MLGGKSRTERRAASVISRSVGEVRSHDSPQLPEELKGDLNVAMWVYTE